MRCAVSWGMRETKPRLAAINRLEFTYQHRHSPGTVQASHLLQREGPLTADPLTAARKTAAASSLRNQHRQHNVCKEYLLPFVE
jgi:hypothetical protein